MGYGGSEKIWPLCWWVVMEVCDWYDSLEGQIPVFTISNIHSLNSLESYSKRMTLVLL